MLTKNHIRPTARAALLVLAAAPRHKVSRDGELVERRVMSTRTLAKRLGLKPAELAPVMHTLACEPRTEEYARRANRGYVERAHANAHEGYAAVTWALVVAPEVEALIAELGEDVGPGRIVFDLVEIRQDRDGASYQPWSSHDTMAPVVS